MICIMGGYLGKQIIAHRNLEDLYHRLGKLVHRRKASDCVDLPERVYQRVDADLSPREERAYRSMARDCWAQLCASAVRKRGAPGGRVLTAESVLTQILRLQQLTGGLAAPSGVGA